MKMHVATVVLAGALVAGCFSAAPPAPPVRWFDPLPAVDAAAPRVAATFRCRAANTVAREFVFRVGPRELVYDSEHRWSAEPAQLVEQALQARGSAGGAAPFDVLVEAFEFDLVAAPTARVALVLFATGAAPRRVATSEVATSTRPEALAEAMAASLASAVRAVVDTAAAAGAPK